MTMWALGGCVIGLCGLALGIVVGVVIVCAASLSRAIEDTVDGDAVEDDDAEI